MKLLNHHKTLSNSILVRLKGGLGNQMFQYALAKALSLTNNSKLIIDISFLHQNNKTKGDFIAREFSLNVFPNIKDPIINYENLNANKNLKKIYNFIFRRKINYCLEKSLEFDSSILSKKPSILLDGYWQSELYFKRFRNEICQAFNFFEFHESDSNCKIYQSIQSGKCPVSVHIRRGDYLNEKIYEFHGICSKEYYISAFNVIYSKFKEPTFYFFSDDTEWVKKELLSYVENYEIIEGNSDRDSWKDMFLMKSCSHHIIANSSFSWWGAWLNNSNEKIVIAPANWFKEEKIQVQASCICPEKWIRL